MSAALATPKVYPVFIERFRLTSELRGFQRNALKGVIQTGKHARADSQRNFCIGDFIKNYTNRTRRNSCSVINSTIACLCRRVTR